MFHSLAVMDHSCACAIAIERVCAPVSLLASGEFRSICFITSECSRSGYRWLTATVRTFGTTDERTVWRRNIGKFVTTDRPSLTYSVPAVGSMEPRTNASYHNLWAARRTVPSNKWKADKIFSTVGLWYMQRTIILICIARPCKISL